MQIPQNGGANLNRVPESIELVPAAGARILLVGTWDASLPEELRRRGATQIVGLVPVGGVAGAAGMDAVHAADLAPGLSLPYPAGHFDVIWLDDALERAHDPAGALRALRGLVKDNGRLVCHVANVRNEWVIMRLLVDGDWAKPTDGVVRPEHARFFTRRDLDRVLAEARLEVEGDVLALRSQPSAWLENAVELVRKLGGDVEKFQAEATVVRFVVVARPEGAAAHDAATPDPWDGARSTRILVAPLWNDPNDAWPDAVEALCKRVTGTDDTTIGITMPPGGVKEIPPPLLAFARAVSTDIVLLDAPADINGWKQLLGKAQMYVATGERPDLLALARSAGVQIADVRAGV